MSSVEFVAKHGHDQVMAAVLGIMDTWDVVMLGVDHEPTRQKERAFIESRGLLAYLDEHFGDEQLGIWDAETVGSLKLPTFE